MSALDALEKKARVLESGDDSSTPKKKGLADFNAKLAQIYVAVNSADTAPTADATAEAKQQIELLDTLLAD